MDVAKTLEPAPNDMTTTWKKKTRGLNFCKGIKHESISTDMDLKSRIPYANLADAEFITLYKDRKYGSECKPDIRLASDN